MPNTVGLNGSAGDHCHAVSHTRDSCDHTTHKTTVSSAGDHSSVTEGKRDPCKWEKEIGAGELS